MSEFHYRILTGSKTDYHLLPYLTLNFNNFPRAKLQDLLDSEKSNAGFYDFCDFLRPVATPNNTK